MKGSSRRVSRTHTLVCPTCELGELRLYGPTRAKCCSCDSILGDAALEGLRQIVTLPETIGAHACECGHPEMRKLPDGVFHCPACGSEVLPIGADPSPATSRERSGAYWIGWLDGFYGNIESTAWKSRLARLEDPLDTLDYYRGHRAGRKNRLAENRRLPKASYESSGKRLTGWL